MTSAADAGSLPTIAVALGDPNGIGPEIAVAAALDEAVRAHCRPVLVGDAEAVDAGAAVTGTRSGLHRAIEAGEIGLEPVRSLGGPPEPGAVTAAGGRAAVDYARAAIALAVAGRAAAVVAAPHNETAVARAGIPFDGYPGLLARETGTDPDAVFLMLVTPRHRIVHVTLHVPLRAALDALTPARVLAAARAAHRALVAAGIERPRIAACGINPHAGEGGLFGAEDAEIVAPAVAAARVEGLDVDGPTGADVLLADGGYDAYLAMYHDQGHIPAKLAGRGNALGVSIGTGVLFSTVAHGSAHDIAGRGVADPAAMTRTLGYMAGLVGGPEEGR